MEAGLHILILLLLLLLCRLKTILCQLVLVGEGISVHDRHVINTFHPSLSEISYEKVTLLIRIFHCYWGIVGRGIHRLVLSLPYDTALVDDGVITHVKGSK